MTILREVSTGIEFLHSLGVVHCTTRPHRNRKPTPVGTAATLTCACLPVSLSPCLFVSGSSVWFFLHALTAGDIKPRNILLTPDNQVKVSDMGLSKKLEEEETSFTFSTNAPSGDGGWAPSEVLLCKRKTMKVGHLK